MARAIASICCSPPDMVIASWSSRSARRGKIVAISAMRLLSSCFDLRGDEPEPQVLAHRQSLHDAAFLRHIGQSAREAGMRRRLQYLLALEHDRAFAAIEQPHHRFQRRGLAGAVAADQADDLALAHLQADVLQDMARSVPGIELADLKDRLRHRFSAPAGRDRRA